MRLGILGLGRNWRHLRAIVRRSKAWTVTVIFDQVQQLASREALRVGARAAESVYQLVSWPELDAIIYCDAQWFGLWPLELAIELRGQSFPFKTNSAGNIRSGAARYRPWLCFVSPIIEGIHADRLLQRLADAEFPILFDWPQWRALPLRRLRHLVLKRLGQLLWASAEYIGEPDTSWAGTPTPTQFSASQRLRIRWLSGLTALTQLTGTTAEQIHADFYRSGDEAESGLVDLTLRSAETRFPGLLYTVEIPRLADRFSWRWDRKDAPVRDASFWQLRLVGEAGELIVRGLNSLEWHSRRGRTIEIPRYKVNPLLASLRHFARRIEQADWQPATLYQLADYCRQLAQV